jgi:hypothetical protein
MQESKDNQPDIPQHLELSRFLAAIIVSQELRTRIIHDGKLPEPTQPGGFTFSVANEETVNLRPNEIHIINTAAQSARERYGELMQRGLPESVLITEALQTFGSKIWTMLTEQQE